MKKEEFLAISLPYGLNVYDCIGESIELVDYSKGCPKCVCEAIGKTKNENKCVNVFQAAFDKQLKPILHKLSDLTKEIEHNGEKFIPIVELNDIFLREWCDLFDESIDAINEFCNHNDYSKILFLPCLIINKLIEWKFDVAELIDKNEAIDVNKLEVNPYK